MGYGWQTWMSSHGYRLDGAFGQYVLVLPEQDAVIVSTNNCPAAGPGAIQTVLSTMWQRLVPALDRTAHSDPEPDDADHTLADDDVTEVVRTIPTIDGDFDPVRSVQTMLEGGHLVVAPGQNGWSLRHSQQGVVTRRPSTPPQRWENLRPSSMRSTKQRWGARRTAGGAPADLSCQIRHFVDLPPTFVDLRHQHLKIKR